MEAPQIVMICLYVAGLILHTAKHGEEKQLKTYHVGWQVLAIIISALHLWWGGFWD